MLRASLDAERSSFMPHYRELADYIMPRRPQFSVADANKGERRNLKIIDATATLSARTLRAGMMIGYTNPAKPWFRLTTPDPSFAEIEAVKDYLQIVTDRMTTVFLRSNLYNILPLVYGDIGVFATAAMGIEEDLSGDVLRFYSFPIGSYMIAANDKLKVDVFFREFRLTVRQLVKKFGSPKAEEQPQDSKSSIKADAKIDWSNISIHVKNYYDRKQYDVWIDICHVVLPNTDYNPNNPISKRYKSVYYEKGMTGKSDYMQAEDKLLRESGFSYFPVLCPRWEVTGEDVYGTECPGMIALGAVKALQVMQKRKAQAIEKMVNPPLIAPAFARNTKISMLPADVSWLDERDGMKGIRPLHEVNPKIAELLNTINEMRNEIKECFYENLFLMFTQSDRRMMTAREVDEKSNEKQLIGSVLEQLNQDLSKPLIDITFDIMQKQGLLPPPPPEIQGVALKVEYISAMAQAQKMVGVSGVEKFAGFVNELVKGTQSVEVLDKVDFDQMVDVYGDLMSINPSIIRADEVVAKMRQQRQAAAAAKAKMELMAQAGKALRDVGAAGKDLSGMPPDQQPDLSGMLGGNA